MPFALGYDINVIPSESTNPTVFQYATLGTAPNREFVVECDYMHTCYDYAYNYNTYTSFQTVIYEAGISAFQFNYGPTVGSNPFGYSRQQWSALPLNVNGVSFPGSWSGYMPDVVNEGSYFFVEEYGGICGMKLTANNYIMVDFNANGWNANNQFYVAYNTPYGANGMPLFPDTTAATVRHEICYCVSLISGGNHSSLNEQPYALSAPFTPTATLTNDGSSVPTSLRLFVSEVGVGQVYNQTKTILAANLPAARLVQRLLHSERLLRACRSRHITWNSGAQAAWCTGTSGMP